MKPRRSYGSDFLAGVDPTGTRTFQYGMEDQAAGQASGLRRGMGTLGGAVGGAAVIPAATGGLIGGVQGLVRGRGGIGGRLLSGGKGLLSGMHKPYTSLYRGIQGSRALATHQAGKALTSRQATHLTRLVRDAVPESMQQMARVNPGQVRGLLSQLNPQQMSGVRRHLAGEIGGGAATLGLSGAIAGGSAHMQYGKGQQTTKRLQSPGLLSQV